MPDDLSARIPRLRARRGSRAVEACPPQAAIEAPSTLDAHQIAERLAASQVVRAPGGFSFHVVSEPRGRSWIAFAVDSRVVAYRFVTTLWLLEHLDEMPDAPLFADVVALLDVA